MNVEESIDHGSMLSFFVFHSLIRVLLINPCQIIYMMNTLI